MKLRTLFIVSAVVSILYGLGALILTPTLNSMYGLGTTASEITLGRFFGVGLLTLGLVNWFARDFTGASARPLVLAGAIGDTIGFIVALIATLSGVMNAVGWSAVAIYLLLALGFIYFAFMAPGMSRVSSAAA